MGFAPVPVWRIARIMQIEFVDAFLCKPHATQNAVGLFFLLEWWCDSLSLKLFVVFVDCCCHGHREDQFSDGV